MDYQHISSSANSLDASPDAFERAIIGCLLECKPEDAAKIAGKCDPEVFSSPINLYVYQILRNAAFAQTPLGKTTGAAAIEQAPGSLEHFSNLEEVTEYLVECCNSCKPFASWPEYVKQIHLAHTRRKLLAAFDDATISALSAQSAEDAMGDAIFKVIEAAGELRRNSIKETHGISSVAERYFDRYESGNAISFTYPQEKLNVAGGGRAGQVVVVAAKTGGKKSWWVLDVALHAARQHGRSCRIYTLEMDENDIIDRALAIENDDLELDDLILQKVDPDTLQDCLQDLAELPISIVDNRISPGRIVSDIAAMGEDRPDIIVVDHLDLFSWKDGNEVNALKGALANFKDAAKMYGVTFILVSQFRRPRNDDEDKYPTIGMLKGGSAIEQISDMIVFMNTEIVRSHFGDEEKTFMSVPKLRQGKPPSKFRVHFKDYKIR